MLCFITCLLGQGMCFDLFHLPVKTSLWAEFSEAAIQPFRRNKAIITKCHLRLLPPLCHSKMSHFISGKYYRADLNFPSTLPKRKDSMKHFEYDPPLSCCGIFQSRLIGKLNNILLQMYRIGKQAFIICKSSYWLCSRKSS